VNTKYESENDRVKRNTALAIKGKRQNPANIEYEYHREENQT
jgi:hypothetical protein